MSGNTEKKTFGWTPEQAEVISYGKGDLLVSASAGSGKTTVMLERVKRLIDDGGSIGRMLISTFTVSAADDMRVKLARKLREAYAESGDGRYIRELDILPGADICTLDKWCLKIARRYFYVCGDDPAFDISDGAESALWMNESIAAAFAEEEEKRDDDYVELCACYVRGRKDDDMRKIVRRMLQFASARENGREWIANAAHAYCTDECDAVINGRTESLYAAVRRALDAFERSAAAAGLSAEAARFVDEINIRAGGGLSDVRWLSFTGKIAEDYACREARESAKTAVKALAEHIGRVCSARDDEAKRTVGKLSAIALRALDVYDGIKKERGKLDFSDVQRRAIAILESDAGDGIRAALDYVFIDESQDINPMQAKIISLLGRGNMFFVGDVKQSIYAFRNSEPKEFLRRKAELSSSGGTMELNVNHRSSQGILGFCNRLFSGIMTESFGEIDYAGDARFMVRNPAAGGAEYREAEDCDDGSVEIFLYGGAEKETRAKPDFSEPYSVRNDIPSDEAEGGTADEADAVVRRIVGLVEEGYGYDDIAVLYRSAGPVVSAVRAGLVKCGIPVTGMSGSFTDGRVSRLLVNVLTIADNFCNDVPLVSVMLSPVGGFDEEELAEMRAAFPQEKHFFGCVTKYAETENGGKARAFTDKMNRYARLSRLMRPGELAGTITSENRLFAAALAEESGAGRADELGRLLRAASGFTGSLSEFLAALPEMVAERDKIMPPGSVRMMTVHASKGLEFGAVVLCGLSKNYNAADIRSSAIADEELGLGMESRSSATNEKLPSRPLLAIRIKAEKSAREEEMRILYVALTRAKRKLVIPLSASAADKVRNGERKSPEDATSFADLILPAAVARGFAPAPDRDMSEFRGREAHAVDEHKLRALSDMLRPAADLPPSDIKKTVTGLLAEVMPSEDLALGVRTLTGAEYEGEGAGEAMRRGTAYHAALENADFALPADEQAARLAACVPDFSLVDLRKLDAAISAMRSVTQGAAAYREQPFVFETDGELLGERAGLIVQGVIDLMAIRGGECEIVDYKTGGINAARREKYTRQLAIYSQAAEKLLGLKVTRARAYLIDEMRFMD